MKSSFLSSCGNYAVDAIKEKKTTHTSNNANSMLLVARAPQTAEFTLDNLARNKQ